MTSILRYPGGKQRGYKTIIQYFPSDLKQVVSPFFGGGSVEIALARVGLRVYGADVFDPLVHFWKYALTVPDLLADAVEELRPVSYDDFYRMRGQFSEYEAVEKAAVFFVMNRVSFSGITFRGYSCSEILTDSVVEKLRNFQAPNVSVDCLDWRETINRYQGEFLYLDPPYPNSDNLYGYRKGTLHTEFDHEGLADTLKHCDDWIMSNCDSPLIRELYADFEIIPLQWKYSAGWTGKRELGKELLIRNCDRPCIQPSLF